VLNRADNGPLIVLAPHCLSQVFFRNNSGLHLISVLLTFP
jgi:hypothetical protein